MRTTPLPKRYFICFHATQAVRKMVAYYDRELEPLGLTAHQAMALGVLWAEDGLSLGQFAERAGIGKAAAVTMIDRLAGTGLVIREEHPDDARLNRLRVTEKGWDLVSQVVDKVDRLESAIEEAMGGESLKSLIRGLTIIRKMDI